MAVFLPNGLASSLTIRLNILTLILIVYLCFCSTSSSSRLYDIDLPLSVDYNDPSSSSYEYVPMMKEHHYLPSRNEFRRLLLQSMFYPRYSHSKSMDYKRYTSQGFHAMRG